MIEKRPRGRAPGLKAPNQVADERGIAPDVLELRQHRRDPTARFEDRGFELADAVENIRVAVLTQTGTGTEVVHDERGAHTAFGGDGPQRNVHTVPSNTTNCCVADASTGREVGNALD